MASKRSKRFALFATGAAILLLGFGSAGLATAGHATASDAKMMAEDSNISFDNHSVTPRPAITGETIELSVTVTNHGSTEETRFIAFGIGDESFDREVTLAPGEQTEVSVNVTVDRPGEHDVDFARRDLGDLTVNSRLERETIFLNESAVDIGEPVLVNTTFSNPTNQTVNESIRVQLGGDSATKNVSVPANESHIHSAVLTPERAGVESVRVAGVSTGEKIQVNSPVELAEGSVDINRSSITTGETLSLNFTLRNPDESGHTVNRNFSVEAPGHYQEVNVTLAPGDTQDFNLTLSPTQAESNGELAVEDIVLGEIEVVSPVKIENIDVDNSIELGEPANVTLQLNNTNSNQQFSRYFRLSANTNDGDKAVASKIVDVGPGETTNATLSLNLDRSIRWYLRLPGNYDTTIAVRNDTSGTPDLSTEYPDNVTVAAGNRVYLNSQVSNNGTADGAKVFTLRQEPNGSIIDQHTSLIRPGENTTGWVSVLFNTPGEETVYINDHPVNVTVTEPYIVDQNVSVVNGTVPEQMPVLEGGYDQGRVNIELRVNGGRSSYDLSRIGADKTTRFKIEMTLRDFDPQTVIVNGRNIEWETTNHSENRSTVTMYVSPTDLSILLNSPSWGEWENSERTANMTIQNTIQYRIYGDSPDSSGEYHWAEGMALSTNAERFTSPSYHSTSEGDRFDVRLGAPHYKADGTLNTGHYTAQIPQSVLDDWGVESTDDLAGNFTGTNDTSLSVTNTSEGMEVSIDLHYSSGKAIVGEEAAVEAATEESSDDPGEEDGGNTPVYAPPTPSDSDEAMEEQLNGTDQETDDSSNETETPDTEDPANTGEESDTDGPGTDEPSDDSQSEGTATGSGEAGDGESGDGSPGFGAVAGIVAIILGLFVRRGIQS